MKKRLANFLLYILLFGLVGASLSLWYDLRPKLAEGNKMMLLSLGVLLLFGIWQYRGLRDVFEAPWKNRYNRFVLYSMLIIMVFMLCHVVWENMLYHSEGTFYEDLVAKLKENRPDRVEVIVSKFSIWSVLGVLVFSMYISVLLSAAVAGVLYMGRIGVGASIAVTIHNWFNAGSFDPSLFIETLLNWAGEVYLSDLWGIVFSAIWLLISTFVLKGNSSSSIEVVS